MASRFLPLWRRRIPQFAPFFKGDPKRQVLLPQYWMKLLKPKDAIPPGIVHFQIHPQMSKSDVKQYLEKIYDVGVLSVRTEIRRGLKLAVAEPKFGRHREEDSKFAFVHLCDEVFEFPAIQMDRLKKKREENTETMKKASKDMEEKSSIYQHVGIPKWFM